MSFTPSLCRGARALLGWTIEDLATAAGVGTSTIISFESGQRTPIRANLEALKRALCGSGVIFLDADQCGNGLRLTRTTEALRDLLLIGALKESHDARFRRAKDRIARFRADATEFYGTVPNSRLRVRSEIEKLRERVDQEIARRSRLQRDDEPTRFLEPITDYLHDNVSPETAG